MKGYKLFLFAIVPIILAMIYPGLHYTLDVGWYTRIESEKSPITFILLGLLLLIAFSYWLLDRKIISTNKYLTLLHFIMTILPLYYILFGPELLFFLFNNDLEKLLSALGYNFFINALFISLTVPLVGQLLFMINIGIGVWGIKNNQHKVQY